MGQKMQGESLGKDFEERGDKKRLQNRQKQMGRCEQRQPYGTQTKEQVGRERI